MRTDLETSLGHAFEDSALLIQALTHRSYASENPGTGFNERFEFLGDAVLQLAITEFLFATYPDLPEGQMAKIRAASVSRVALAEVAGQIDLGKHLRLGRGEETSGGRDKSSILADAMEALLAAVHLDAGYATARKVILELWEGFVRARAESPGKRDYKTRLQELTAATGRRLEYELTGSGPDHDRVFQAQVRIEGEIVASGRGRSKKEAEQAAAQVALELLEP